MTSNREETHAPSDSVMKQMALNILEVLTPMKGHYLVKKKKKVHCATNRCEDTFQLRKKKFGRRGGRWWAGCT